VTDGRIDAGLIEGDVAYYVMNSFDVDSQIEAYNLQARQSKWTIPATTHAPLLSGDGKLFLWDSDQGVLSAVSTADGTTAWHTGFPVEQHICEMVFGDGTLFLGIGTLVYAIDADDGHVLWEYSMPPGFGVSKAIRAVRDTDALSYSDGTLYVRLGGPSKDDQRECLILAVDVSAPKERWRFPFTIPLPMESGPDMIASRPTFEKGSLLFYTWADRLYLVDQDSGEVIWQKSKLSLIQSLLHHDRVYLLAYDNLSCLDAASGKELWSTSLSEMISTSSVDALEDLLVLVAEYREEEQARLVLLDGKTGELVAQVDMPAIEYCSLCISAMRAERNKVYVMRQHSIAAIDLLLPSGQ
jgi:outer membrane protein assembly factor BamB